MLTLYTLDPYINSPLREDSPNLLGIVEEE
jgi:hypothetical protein